MLQESSHDARHPDPLGEARDPGAQAAEAPDVQDDAGARLGGGVQLPDQVGILQLVELRMDPRRAPGAGVIRFPLDHLDEPRAQVGGGDQHLLVAGHLGRSGQLVEDHRNVLADLRMDHEPA